MKFQVDLIVSIVSAITSVMLTAFVGAIAWYLRGEYREHKKNTAVRRWLVGDPELDSVDDEGYRATVDRRFDQLETRIDDQHAEQRDDIRDVKQLVERVAAHIESHPDFDFTRGANSQNVGQRSRDGAGDD